jgi:hypothetical protein
MKKLLVLVLAVLPLLAGAQVSFVNRNQSIILSFNEKNAATDLEKNSFTVPPGLNLHITRIYCEAENFKIKLTVKESKAARQAGLTQSLTFSRADLGKLSSTGITLPEKSSIEFDGVPCIIFCYLDDIPK